MQHPFDEFRRGLADIDARLGRIEAGLRKLTEAQPVQEWYSVKEFSRLVKLAPYTTREHCRCGRIHAERTRGGRGNKPEYRISHAEFLRYQAEGLLPGHQQPIVDKPR